MLHCGLEGLRLSRIPVYSQSAVMTLVRNTVSHSEILSSETPQISKESIWCNVELKASKIYNLSDLVDYTQ